MISPQTFAKHHSCYCCSHTAFSWSAGRKWPMRIYHGESSFAYFYRVFMQSSNLQTLLAKNKTSMLSEARPLPGHGHIALLGMFQHTLVLVSSTLIPLCSAVFLFLIPSVRANLGRYRSQLPFLIKGFLFPYAVKFQFSNKAYPWDETT